MINEFMLYEKYTKPERLSACPGGVRKTAALTNRGRGGGMQPEGGGVSGDRGGGVGGAGGTRLDKKASLY